MGAVWVRARAELRSGWRRSVGLVLLIGLVGGAAIAAAAAARRTDSALARFNRAQRAVNVLMVDDGSEAPYHPGDDVARIAKLPAVSVVARARFTYVLGNDGILVPADGALGSVVNRGKLLHGRFPRSSQADEVVVSFDAAKRNHLRVGSTFPLIDVSYPVAADLVRQDPAAQQTFRVVGIVAVPGSLPPYQPGGVSVYGTPALYRLLAAHEDVFAAEGHHALGRTPDSLVIRLRGGQADVPAFRRAVQAFAGNARVTATTLDYLDGNARRSVHLQAQALWLLAALLGFSALLVLGQTMSRFIALEGADTADLRALGMTGRQLWAVAMARMALLGAAAAAVGTLVAALASPLSPLGVARTIEPSPGVSMDGAALALGAAVIVAFVAALSAYPAWRTARPRPAADLASDRPSILAGGVARAGFPPAVVAGTRMALETGRGRTAVPVRSTVVGATVGVAALAAALTFGTSLSHLLETPRLYGVTWHTRMTNYGGGGDDAHSDPDLSHVVDLVAKHPGVAAVSAAIFGQTPIGGRDTGLLAVRGSLRPPILAGRYPSGPTDIALGVKTTRRLHVHIGSAIEVTGPSGRPLPFRVVGKTVLPADGDPRLGEGMLLSTSGVERAVQGTEQSAAADSLLIRFTPGANRLAVVDDIQRQIGPRVTDGGLLDVLTPQKPTDLVSFGGVKSLPFILAGILAVVAVATLAHLLVSAVRRRRRDLAILKTIGFVRRQVTAAVAWQATTLAAVALLAGLPVGVAVGRWLWAWFASQQGVVAEPRVPFSAIVLVIPAAVVLANIVAALPARAAGLTRPALVLRTE